MIAPGGAEIRQFRLRRTPSFTLASLGVRTSLPFTPHNADGSRQNRASAVLRGVAGTAGPRSDGVAAGRRGIVAGEGEEITHTRY